MSAMSNFMEGEIIKNTFRTPTTVADWVADTVTAVGDRVVATTFNGWIYEATAVAGDFKTHATTEPTWPTTLGGTVVDDQVTWITYKIGMVQRPLYVGLFGSTSSLVLLEAGTLTGEQTGTSYARKQLDPLDANWDAIVAGNGATANTADLAFTAAGAADWDDVYRIAILDSAVGGTDNVLFAADLTSVKSVGNGKAFTFNAGDLVITVA